MSLFEIIAAGISVGTTRAAVLIQYYSKGLKYGR